MLYPPFNVVNDAELTTIAPAEPVIMSTEDVHAATNKVRAFFYLGSFVAACSKKDYCSPVFYLENEAKNPFPSLVAFNDSPGKVWAACIFFVPVHTRGKYFLYNYLNI